MKTLTALLVPVRWKSLMPQRRSHFCRVNISVFKTAKGQAWLLLLKTFGDLNLVNEVGEPSRAWIDYPGHIWAQYWNEGALYSRMASQYSLITVPFGSRFVPPPPILRSRG